MTCHRPGHTNEVAFGAGRQQPAAWLQWKPSMRRLSAVQPSDPRSRGELGTVRCVEGEQAGKVCVVDST